MEGSRGRKERLAISNLTNNSAIGDFINGTAVPTEGEAFFNVFSDATKVAQLLREHIIVALINLLLLLSPFTITCGNYR